MKRFDFHSLRFEFDARERIVFPPGLAANTLRGALGLQFRREACVPGCPGARMCELRRDCAYAKVFEPSVALRVADAAHSPSGLADWPRPFVFRTRHLDGRTIGPGEEFHFTLNVFSPDPQVLESFRAAFAGVARAGMGRGRGVAELLRVRTVPGSVDLTPRPRAAERIRVHFLSPCELKHEGGLAERPEFPILFARIRDRISTLRALYGPGPLEIDFEGTGKRAAAVRMTWCEVRRIERMRRSTRTGQQHSIGGFTGYAEYEGDIKEFLPWLEAAHSAGVGRQAVWGNGEIEVTEIRP